MLDDSGDCHYHLLNQLYVEQVVCVLFCRGKLVEDS